MIQQTLNYVLHKSFIIIILEVTLNNWLLKDVLEEYYSGLIIWKEFIIQNTQILEIADFAI